MLKKKQKKLFKKFVQRFKKSYFSRYNKNFFDWYLRTSSINYHTTRTAQKKQSIRLQKYIVHVRVTTNNIFCTFSNAFKNKVLITVSSGICNFKMSKKNWKHIPSSIVYSFIKRIRRYLIRIKMIKRVSLSIQFSGLKTTRFIPLVKQFRKGLRYFMKTFSMEVLSRKCFNGCIPKKKRRKKRLRFIVWK
jgi:hypothetical protein